MPKMTEGFVLKIAEKKDADAIVKALANNGYPVFVKVVYETIQRDGLTCREYSRHVSFFTDIEALDDDGDDQ